MAGVTIDQDLEELFGKDDDDDTAVHSVGAPGLKSPVEGEDDLFGDYVAEIAPRSNKSPSESASRKRRLRQSPPDAAPAAGRQAATGSRAPRPERASKKRRPDIEKYLDIEAEEAGGSEDEDEDADMADLIDDTGAKPTEKSLSEMRKAMEMNQKELEELQRTANRRGPLSGASRLFSMDKLNEMEERYARIDAGEEVASQADQADFHPGDKVTHTVTVPEPGDPKLWCVKTFGPEKQLCISLMIKSFESMRDGKDVPIYSVFYGSHLRGYIYIEAHRENDVKDFIKGIKGMSAFGGFALVPNSQMPMVFTASQADAKNNSLIQVGDWVRLKRGLYGGDLAQVDEVHDGGIYMLKMKPRIPQGSDLKNALKSNKSRRRPVPRWFNRADIEAGQELLVNTELRKTHTGWKHFYVVDEETYRDGFLYKTFKSGWFISGDSVRPQEYELQEWRNAPLISENNRPQKDLAKTKEEEEREQMPPPSAPRAHKKQAGERQPLFEGDPVIVISGDLKNLRGSVTKALFGSPTVLIKPSNIPGIDGELSIAASRLCKYFEVGNYVKIVSGANIGDTGHVTKVEVENGESWSPETAARVLSLSLTNEFRVRVDDMRLTIEKPEPQDRVGEFKLEQLVCVEGRSETRAIIVRLEADSRAWVLGQDGKKICVDFAEMEPVPLIPGYKRKVWSQDRKGHTITPGCSVKAPRSLVAKSAPIQAEVKYIHNSMLFLKATEALTGERAFFVCPADKCEYIYNRFDMPSRPPRGITKTKEPEKPEENIEAKQLTYGITQASKVSFLKPGWFRQLGLEKEPGSQIVHTLKKGDGVRIIGGGYKGLRGEIRDLLGDMVRISILAKPKIVETSVNNVEKDEYILTEKEERWPGTAPETPKGESGRESLPVPKEEQLVSAEQQVLQALQQERDLPTDEQSWNPAWLASADQPPGSGAPTPLTPGGPATPPDLTSVQPPSRSSARKRRAPRIPGTASGEGTPQTLPATPGAVPATPPEFAGSQHSASSAALIARDGPLLSLSPKVLKIDGVESMSPSTNLPKARSSWFIEGLGVQYKKGEETKYGWIVKVYANMAHVLPANERVAAPLPFDDSEITPRPCKCRGDVVIVFDGPKKGVKGKVTGVESDNTVFIRSEKTGPAAVLCGPMVRAAKKEVALYSADPEASVIEAVKVAGTEQQWPQTLVKDAESNVGSNGDGVSDIENETSRSQAEDTLVEDLVADACKNEMQSMPANAAGGGARTLDEKIDE